MTEASKRLRVMGALSLRVVSLLAAVQTLSPQDKSTTAQASEQIASPTSQEVRQSSDPVPPAAQKIVDVTQKWLAGRLSSTPGVSAQLREVSRTTVNGRFQVKYHLFVTGAPKDQTYTMFNWPPNAQSPSPTLEGLSLLENGLIVCAGRMPEQCGDAVKKDDPVEWTFYPLPGEVIRSTLISQDQKTKLFFAIVPDPVMKNDNGCTLEAIRLTQKNELLLVRANGFQPNEDLEFQSKSYDEKRGGHAKTDAQGEYFVGLMPFVKDKKRGTTEIRLKGAKCAPALTFEWGDNRSL